MASQCRQNYHAECEAAVNKQINLELNASYFYQSLCAYFSRDDVALKGFAKFFHHNCTEEREHAEELIKFQNSRGGRVVLQNIEKPAKDVWGSGLEAMETALAMEKKVNQALLDLHQIAGAHSDPHMSDFIEEKYLREQVESIKALADHVTNLKRVGPGLGEYLYDKETLQE